MEIQEISRADILDILFEGRNKDYGAYQLRKTYNRRLTRALAGMASICLLLIGGYTLAGRSHPSKIIPTEPADVTLIDARKEEPIIPPKPLPQPLPQQVATIRNTIPHIVPADQVKPEDVPPTDDKLNDDVKIGTADVKGAAFDGTLTGPPSTGTGAGTVIEPPKPQEDNTIFTKVETESFYPAGMQAWLRFVSKNFRVPEEAINNNEINGTATVMVQFVVDKEGNVSDVQAIEGPESLRAEAVRVIKKSGKWTPAIQNGRQVNSYKRQPIKVMVENE